MFKHIRNKGIPVLLLILIILAPQILAAQKGDSKPNIVLVLMDNFGW